MRRGWWLAVSGAFALVLAAASISPAPASPDIVTAASPAPSSTPLATTTVPALPTARPPSQSRLFAPGAARTYANPPPTPTPKPPGPDCTDLLAHISKSVAMSGNCIPPNLQEIPANYSYLIEDEVLLLRADVIQSLVDMLDAAEEHGLYPVVRSAYRSYHHQDWLFEEWVKLIGYDEALRTSAMPGHSEHQLGSVIDITSYTNQFGLEGFEQTTEGQWLAQNSYLYGFVMSYPPGTEQITGYAYEPWHFRYIGRANAKAMHDSGLTLHDFLGR